MSRNDRTQFPWSDNRRRTGRLYNAGKNVHDTFNESINHSINQSIIYLHQTARPIKQKRLTATG